jgi:hypothetical protein
MVKRCAALGRLGSCRLLRNPGACSPSVAADVIAAGRAFVLSLFVFIAPTTLSFRFWIAHVRLPG